MAYDRREIWRNVADIYAKLEKKALDGRVPVVEVYLTGRELPVITAVVETSRDSEYPWIKLSTGDQEPSYVLTFEAYVQRVEIRFRSKAKFKAGFRAELDDASGPE
jgi:hypothetical protein